MKKCLSLCAMLLATFTGLAGPSDARAGHISTFNQITTNGATNVASNFTVTAFGAGDAGLASFGGAILSSQALFVFQNAFNTPSSITQLYFEGSILSAIASIRQSAGVSYNNPATPGNLPAGNSITPNFDTTGNNSAGPRPQGGVSNNGVNSPTEWVGILFNLQSGKNFTDVVNALNNWQVNGLTWGLISPNDPGLRIGIHVQAFSNFGGVSESFVTGTPPANPVPEPGSMALMGTGLACLAARWRKTRRKSSVTPSVEQPIC